MNPLMEKGLLYHLTWKMSEELVECLEIDRGGLRIPGHIHGYRILTLASTLPNETPELMSYLPWNIAEQLEIRRIGDSDLPTYVGWPEVSSKLAKMISKI